MTFSEHSLIAGKQSSSLRTLTWLAVLFVLWRFVILTFMHPRYYFLWPGEELYRGLFGWLLMQNKDLPLLSLLPDDYGSGGTLTVGFLTSLTFRLLGPTVFALKLVPFFFSFCSMTAWYLLTRKYFNPRVALYTALFQIFSPPRYIAYSLTAMGDHYETVFFMAVTLLLFFKIVIEKREKWIYPALLGLVAGYSLWFAYIFGLTLLACLIFWRMCDPGFFKRRVFWIAVLGFFAGFSPWFIINLKSNFQGLVIYGIPFWEHFSLHHLIYGFRKVSRLQQSAPGLFFRSFLPDIENKPAAYTVQMIYLSLIFVPILGGLITVTRTKLAESLLNLRAHPAGWFWIYFLIFFAAVQMTRFRDCYYFFPLVTAAYALAAYYLDWFFNSKFQGGMAAGRLFVPLLVGASLFANISKFSVEHAGKIFSTKGYSYFTSSYSSLFSSFSFCKDLVSCCSNFPKLGASMTPREIHSLAMGASRTFVENALEENPLSVQPTAACPLFFHKYFYYMMGTELFARYQNLEKTVKALEPLKQKMPTAHILAVRGALTEFGRTPVSEEEFEGQIKLVKAMLRPSEVRFLLRAEGEQKTYRWLSLPVQEKETLNGFLRQLLEFYEEEQKIFAAQGAGRAFLRKAKDSRHPGRYLARLEKLQDEELRQWLFEGAGMAMLSKDMVVSRFVFMSILEPYLDEASIKAVTEGQEKFVEFFQDLELESKS